jgi:peptide subunit release factor 1 (eRF1)
MTPISTQRLQQLAELDGHGARILSLYLDLDPHSAARRGHRIALEDLAKGVRRTLDKSDSQALQAEIDRVQAWLDSGTSGGNGVAIFSCAPRNVWEAEYLPVRVDNHLAFEPKPDLAPLLDVIDEYERYAVALVDKSKARLFSVFMGRIEEHREFEDYVPPKHDQGGWSQANFQRHHEAHVFRHLKRVTRQLAFLLRRRGFDRLIIAGPEEATSELRAMLPRILASRLAATIPAEMYADDREILERTLEVERSVERERESRLVSEVLEMAGAGGRATCGVPRTLEALWIGDVQTLVVSEGVEDEGSECGDCGRLERGRLQKCPACGNPMHPVHDVFHRAMGRTLQQSGSVEVVHGEPARLLVQAGGGLGARLRYRLPVPSGILSAAI